MIRVYGVKLSIDQDASNLKNSLIKKLKIGEKDLVGYKIFKQSIDARKHDTINFVYTVDVELKQEDSCLKKFKNKDITIAPDLEYKYVQTGSQPLQHRPVIIGTGPAGLFAGVILAEMGYGPVVMERGADVDTRAEAVRKFWEHGLLDPECNVQFGEGGAGTFSDGKLTTLIRDRRCRKVLSDMTMAGAPEEIMYAAKPHVGTDRLRSVVKKIRERIISLGGEVRFNCKVTDLITKDNHVQGIIINGTERLAAEVVVLAPGHSARDTFEMLYQAGVTMIPKPFSVGVRIEHPQKLIDAVQYKKFAGHPKLGPADYKLAYHTANGRSAYTFCMCPGGVVVAASSEEEGVVTNGMSAYSRSGENANSALLVGVEPADFGSSHPLAGVAFQRKLERKAYILGGSDYKAPVQLVGDFLENRPSTRLGQVEPSYRKGVQPAALNECLPDFVVETMKMAIPELDKKLKGFALPDAVMTAVETRSSSPVRIVRNEFMEASLRGLYPAGEGAGHAGGIVSAAVDGIKAAEAIASKYASPSVR
ncbi:NAD(P)/FAD-dependent oxidoreductase [Pelotomaculum schinkii]|uniref:NAD(P)/FAD-dependent oxidoreductase n=1 Tax=Pelotomaculum schinkii TaxID=78350 RepID=UPI00167E88DF|nr:hypothetical protein [Pelotomaculum schinkii]